MRRRFTWAGAAALTAALAVAVPPAHAAQDDAVYGLANGCYTLKANGSDAGAPYRLKAITLGRFMFYAPDGTYIATDGDAIVKGSTAGPAADFTVDHTGTGFTISATGSAKKLTLDAGKLGLSDSGSTFALDKADGCATYPEAEINVEGPVYKGPTSFGETRGFVDAHMHMMGFEFLGGAVHCGAPWDGYGITVALRGCEDTNLGTGVTESALQGGNRLTIDQKGWPTFKDWPDHGALTHEQSYYMWLERAWRAGERIFVNLFVENHALCEIEPQKKPGYDCNEMHSVEREAKDLKNLETYIDAQWGGPGKGWFRIVKDPFEARRVINAGKMAIVPGIEVSNLFDCGLTNGVSKCTDKDVDERLDHVYREFGVRDMELINKFDNGFGGVAGDGGATGVLVNVGNFYDTGRFWNMKPCNSGTSDTEKHDNEQYGLPSFFSPLANLLPPGSVPVYTSGAQCNTMGLTALGTHLVDRMMEKGMLIDPDHLSVLARDQLLDRTEAKNYPGVVSSHSWSTQDAYPRIYKAGGFIAPYAGDSKGFLKQYKRLKSERDPRFFFGMGWGADMNGFGGQGGPRLGASNPVKYPFKSWDGKATISKQVTGQRTFDINTDGVSHYGLYPDWVEDLRMQGGQEVVDDLTRGSEAYLQTWERAVGVAPSYQCRQSRLRFTAAGIGAVKLGTSAEDVLRGAGQPKSRWDRTWKYCVSGKNGGQVKVVFTKQGTSGLIVSTAARHRIGGIGKGSRATALKGTRKLRTGLLAKSAGKGKRYIFGVRKGRVVYTGVVAASVAGNAKELSRELKLAGLR